MRSYTFALSLVAHAVLIGSAIVGPIFATADLPEPPRSSTFELVTAVAPEVPPPAPRPRTTAGAPGADAAPSRRTASSRTRSSIAAIPPCLPAIWSPETQGSLTVLCPATT